MLVPARANGQPAFGAYLRAPAGISHGTGLFALTLTGDRICAITRFDNSVLPWFGYRDRSPADSQLHERAIHRGYERAPAETGCPKSFEPGIQAAIARRPTVAAY